MICIMPQIRRLKWKQENLYDFVHFSPSANSSHLSYKFQLYPGGVRFQFE